MSREELIDLLVAHYTQEGRTEAEVRERCEGKSDDELRRYASAIAHTMPVTNGVAGARYFLHVTARKNIRSILKKGLVPNYGGGNYHDGRWDSLEGVYATDTPSVIERHMAAHGLWGNAALIVIEVHDGAAILPDEDMIDMALKKITGEYFGGNFAEIADEIAERCPTPDAPEWQEIADRFHQWAGGGEKDQALLDELMAYWTDHAVYGYGDTDHMRWMEIKDQVVRHYPRMVHPHLGHQHSIRLLGPVGFDGPARIVCIIDIRPSGAKVVYGAVPSPAMGMVNSII